GAQQSDYGVVLTRTDPTVSKYRGLTMFMIDMRQPGVEVRQGNVIGYVGSTGRSTGPHVCFRYWKNGKQVDHRKEKDMGTFPVLKGSSMERFEQRRDSLLPYLNPV
ncbi:MAG: peptidoglycan DD-metalloendopeptidase family protein, partial [Bacteroidota bacterium]